MKRLAHYSQHFLRHPRIVKELIGHTSLKPGDTVLDIGAGSGVISSVLATKVQQVIAIEPEPQTAKRLRENMRSHPNVQVYEGDFLAMSLPDQPYKVFANIPFHLSSAIVRKLVQAANPPQAIYIIVQKQFAHKLLIGSDRFTGQLGAYIAPWFAARIRKPLQKTDFWPHPNVDTALIELLRRPDPVVPVARMAAFQQFTADCFSTPKNFAKMPKADAGIAPNRKPSELTMNQWVDLFNSQRIY
jgi:23S rRNA (adenine-N6)-dimethyltransferase